MNPRVRIGPARAYAWPMRKLMPVVALLMALPCLAWDAAGHREITLAALKSLPPGAPAFLRDEAMRKAIADEATVPDRWRSTRVAQLTHAANPDHYLDVEDLEAYGLTLKSLPTLRYEYVKDMVLARENAGDSFKGRPVNPATDTAKTDEYPGFLAYAIAEYYGRLQSSFRTIRLLEQANDPSRADQLAAAKADAMTNMGLLSHFVGDAAQPLHTTRHHHGWVGDNPKGYTTDRGIHAYIDGGVIRRQHIEVEDLLEAMKPGPKIDADDPWPAVLEHIRRSFAQVEPLYEMKKSGDLDKAPGKAFIVSRMADGAGMLGALYWAAWESAAPTDKSVADFKRYDGR